MVVVNLVLIFIATHLFICLFLFLLFFLLFFLFLKILEVSVILALLFSLFRNPSLMAIEIFDEIGTIIVVLVYWAWVSLRVIFIFLEEHRNLWRSMLKVTPGLNWLTVHVIGYFIFVDILRSYLILQDILVGAESLIIIIYLKILQEL